MNAGISSRPRVARWFVVGLMVAAVCFLAACQSLRSQRPPPVTVGQIIEMTKAGVTSQQIIDQIRASETVFKMPASELIKLKGEGVSDDVINYMQQTYLESVRDEHSSRYYNYPPYYYGYGYGWPYYPPYREVIVVEPRHRDQPHPQQQKQPKK